MSSAPLRAVAVRGNGLAALAAALAFRRSLPGAAVTLFHGSAGGEPEFAGAATPLLDRFNAQTGIDPQFFRQRTGARTVAENTLGGITVPALAQVPHADGVALHQLWLRRGGKPDWLQVARRATQGEDRAAGLGLRFDPLAAMGLWAEQGARAGVRAQPDLPLAADLAADFDLVVDTVGPAQPDGWNLIQGCPGARDWQLGAPVLTEDREDIVLESQVVRWSSPVWLATAGPAAGLAAYHPKPWDGKVLSIGRAALSCESYDGQPLAVMLGEITRALALLPGAGSTGLEAAEYNRRTTAIHRMLIDWCAARHGCASVTPGLDHLVAQFGLRGRIPFRDEDPVPPGYWLSWLIGSGTRPRNPDMAALAVSEARLSELFAGFRPG